MGCLEPSPPLVPGLAWRSVRQSAGLRPHRPRKPSGSPSRRQVYEIDFDFVGRAGSQEQDAAGQLVYGWGNRRDEPEAGFRSWTLDAYAPFHGRRGQSPVISHSRPMERTVATERNWPAVSPVWAAAGMATAQHGCSRNSLRAMIHHHRNSPLRGRPWSRTHRRVRDAGMKNCDPRPDRRIHAESRVRAGFPPEEVCKSTTLIYRIVANGCSTSTRDPDGAPCSLIVIHEGGARRRLVARQAYS